METLTLPTTPRTSGATKQVAPELVQAYDFRSASTLDKERLAPGVAASEVFAQKLSLALTTRLGLKSEVALRSTEQVPCAAFLKKAGEFSYFIALYLGQAQEVAVLEIDSMVLYPLLDLLLGGDGKASEIARGVTDIEDQIARDLVKMMCHEMQAAWQESNLEIRLGTRQSLEQLKQTFASEKAVVFNFSIGLPETGGGFQLMLTVSSSTVFLKIADKEPAAEDGVKKASMSPRLAEKLLDTNFGIELELLQGKVSANDLLNLTLGKILRLGVSVRTPVVLKVGGLETFEAIPVRSGKHRAAQLMDRMAQSPQAQS